MLTVEELREMNAGFQAAEEEEQPQSPIYLAHEQKDDMAQRLHELMAKYDRQSVRFKHVLEERDDLSKQVADLRRKMAEQEGALHGHEGEEIKLLNKLVDGENGLREAMKGSSSSPSNEEQYARHDKFVSAFLAIVTRN